MSTVPCKYFLRNECRFGDNCRFYHPRGGSGMGNSGAPFGNRNLAPSHFNNAPHQQEVINLSAKSQQNMDAMAEMVKKDMVEWDLGKIWPFSSYGPAGNKPSLPGFEDLSQEELRYQYLQNNKMPVDLSQQMRTIQQARQNYQQLTPAVRNILERVIVKGERISESSQSSSGWGVQTNTTTPSTQGIFGGSGTFGSSATGFQTTGSSSSGVFGVTSSPFTFGGTNQPNVDGMESTEVNSIFSQPQQQNNAGLFSTQAQIKPQSQGFGGFSSFGQPFGASQQQQPAPPSFAQPQQTSLFQPQQGSIFGQQQPQTTSIFQTANQPNQSTPFQSSQLQSLLQAPQQPLNAFQTISTQPQLGLNLQQQQQQPLGQAPKQPFSFSLGDSTVPAPVSSAPSIFGGAFSTQATTVPPTSSIFGAPPNQTVGGGDSMGLPVSSTPSIFGAASPFSQQPSTTPPNTSSIFGAPPNQTSTSIFGQQQQQQQPTPSIFSMSGSSTLELKYAYSEESDLTPEELEAFRADHFTLENIPIRPPPKSYCGM